MRNLYELCNDTRVIVRDPCDHPLIAKTTSSTFEDLIVILPRVTLNDSSRRRRSSNDVDFRDDMIPVL